MSNTIQTIRLKMGIPVGDYCYEVLGPIYKTSPDGSQFVYGHKIRYCPFWYGTRPDGGCIMYGWDAGLGDACKSCGLLEELEIE